MDMRYEMRGDGRRLPPRNSRGEFTRRGRGRRMDRGMYDMGYPEMRGDMNYGDMPRGGSRGRRDMGSYPEMDGHHYPMQGGRSGGYEPVEFMGYCTGYAGAKEDYGYPMYDMRGRGGDMGYRNYDMRGRDYGYDYGYPMGDYGETLSEQELEHWNKKLMHKIEDKYKPFFTKENVVQRAKQRGYQMKDFGENELYTATLMQYTDLCKELKPFVGENLDAYIGAGYAFLVDDDTEVKGAEKLTRYFDNVVMGEED